MKVIHIHENDGGGGGGLVAYNLMVKMCEKGHDAKLIVGFVKLSKDSRVQYLRKRAKIIDLISQIPRNKSYQYGIRNVLTNFTAIRPLAQIFTGKEYTNTYGTEHALKKLVEKEQPDIVHLHNLHSNYFDLSALISLSQNIPTVITLHDAWLLTGHCAHFFDCMRWKTGCGFCPYPLTAPTIRKDATAYNWRNRSEIYQKCKLYVTAPSKWMLDAAHESMLNSGIVKSSVIPNGIDLDIFCLGDKISARETLALPKDRFIIIFSARGLKRSVFKDFRCLRKALEILGSSGQDVLCLALGDSGNTEFIGNSVEIRFIPFISDTKVVAQYYQAADVYVHSAKAETFGLVIVEAEACGLPVVASAVGGIPELIIEGETGYLVPSGDANLMADRILHLKENTVLREIMGKNANKLAKEMYDDNVMVEKYLKFYQEIQGD